eukprot:gene18451-24158_t
MLWSALDSYASHAEGLIDLINSGVIFRLLVQGGEASATLIRFLPEPIVILLKSKLGHPPSALQIIDDINENPELIWTKDMQIILRDSIVQLTDNDFSHITILPPDYVVLYPQIQNEIYIDNSSTWNDYKDQSHDLYITDQEKTDYFLIEDASGTKFAGLLTNGPEIYQSATANAQSSILRSKIDASKGLSNISTKFTDDSFDIKTSPTIKSDDSISSNPKDSAQANHLNNNQNQINTPTKQTFKTVITKSTHGIGLDITKSPDGGVLVQRLKEMPDGSVNPATLATPTILPGDRIVGVNGQKLIMFIDVVKAIRSAQGKVEIWFERE